MASISDVAKLAGVSVTTVSKVINNYPDVSPKTRRKVLNIINEMKFQPNVVARGLVKGRSWSVGIFLTSDFSNPFVSVVMSGLKKTLENSGYDLIYLSQGNKDPQYNFVKHCLSRNVDGVVVFGFTGDEKYVRELICSELPTVFIDIDLYGKRAGYITSDNVNGIFQAVEHLYNIGHQKIAYLTPKLGNYVTKIRYEGYVEALNQLSLDFFQDYISVGTNLAFSLQNGYELMAPLLSLPNPPTAVLCASDLLAIGAMRAMEERGLVVPRDMAVVGFDDSDLCDLTRPKLTTVRQDIKLIGERALGMLLEMINDSNYSPKHVIMPTELIVRESCGSNGLSEVITPVAQ
jgi:LacI family transcriptional regulator